MTRKSPFVVKNIKRIIKRYLINSKKVISSLMVFALILVSLISIVAPAAGFTVDERNNILQPIADEEQPVSFFLDNIDNNEMNVNTALDISISEHGSKDDKISIFTEPDNRIIPLNPFNFEDKNNIEYFEIPDTPDNPAKTALLNPSNFEDIDNRNYFRDENKPNNLVLHQTFDDAPPTPPSPLGPRDDPEWNSIVCGNVNNTNGGLIVGADVWLHDLDRDMWANGTQTDGNGYYEIGIYEGWFELGARKNGYFQYYEQIYILDHETVWRNITLDEMPPTTSIVCGYVNDTEGTLIEGVGVGLHDRELNRYANGTNTDSNGYYEIGIYAGNFNIDTNKDGYFQYHDEIIIENYETKWINITLEQKPADTSIVCGYVNNTNDELIVGADVWLHDLNRDTYANGTWTNDNQ